jgi:hypothetical protein
MKQSSGKWKKIFLPIKMIKQKGPQETGCPVTGLVALFVKKD